MNPMLEQYLKNKYGENYESDAKTKYDEQTERSNTGNLFANIGDAIAGRQIGSSNDYFNKINQRVKEDTLGKIDADKKQFVADTTFNNQQKEFETKQAKSDPNSNASISFRKMMETNFPNVAKHYGDAWQNVTADDQESIFKPLQLRETIDARKEQARILAGEREEARKTKAAEKATKDKELSSAQAKQMGLYNMGERAEEQFDKAVADGKSDGSYDPTSHWDFIDNASWMPNIAKSNKAIEAQSAQSTWVENFLRDASGAAIPPNERMAYAKDYFPQPGDNADVVRNKAALRKEKMNNALIGAGPEGQKMAMQAKPEPLAQTPKTVRIRDPKGIIRSIPANQAQAAIDAGGVLIDNLAGK